MRQWDRLVRVATDLSTDAPSVCRSPRRSTRVPPLADPTLVAGWIGETTAIKKAARARLGCTEALPERMSEERIAAIVEALGGLFGLLRRAEPQDRAEIYARIGLQTQYRPGTGSVLAEIRSTDIDRVPEMCPEGDLNPHVR
jgi:site-specific DNA recombinase